MTSSILHIVPYKNWLPPKGGGYLRIFYTLEGLAKKDNVDVLSMADNEVLANEAEFKLSFNVTPYQVKDRICSNLLHKIKRKVKYGFLIESFFEPVDSRLYNIAETINAELSAKKYLFIVLENLSLIKLIPFLRRKYPQAKIIYNCHNVDYLLYDGGKYGYIYNIEKELGKKVDMVWTCSQLDLEILLKINKHKPNIKVVPNGVDTIRNTFKATKEPITNKNLLFIGSLNYLPNIEGLLWFSTEILPLVVKQISDIKVKVVGKGWSDKLEYLRLIPNIEIVGEVDSLEEHYHNSLISIIPLLSGSGTRLKVLEAMSFGSLVVSTSKGIEGIEATNGIHALIADNPSSFAEQIIKTVLKPTEAVRIIRNAKKLVDERFDWNIITSCFLEMDDKS